MNTPGTTALSLKGRPRTLALTFLCQSAQAISLAGFPLLLPLIRQDLSLTFSQAGSLASANLLVYALMQIPAGYLSDRDVAPARISRSLRSSNDA